MTTRAIFAGLLYCCGCLLQPVEPVEENVRGHQNFIPRSLPRLDDHFHAYGTTAAEPTLSPSIDLTTPTNVTVIKGKTAMLACVVLNIGNEAVSWMRLRDINLLAINEETNTKDKRIKAIHVPNSDLWSLRIQDTKLSDAGAYECQVTTDIETATQVHLKVLDPQTEISGLPEVYLSKGSTLNLTCIIRNGPAQQPFIIWTHNSKILKYVGSTNSQETTLGDSSETLSRHPISTRIVVSDTDVQHSGTYNCEPGAAPVASVNVHVLDGKLPAAMQTAAVGTHLHRWLWRLLSIYCIKLIASTTFPSIRTYPL